MPTSDSPACNPAPQTPPRDYAQLMERIGFADQWLSRRLDEVKSAEARLDKRLGVLAQAEENLRGVLDALRQQVTEAYPILNQLAEFRKNIQTGAEEVLAEARAQFSQTVELVRSRLDLLHEAEASFEQKIAGFREQLGESAGPLADMGRVLAEHRAQAKDLLDQLPRQVQARLEVFRKEAQDALELAGRRLAEQAAAIDRNASAAQDWLEEQVSLASEGLEKRFGERLDGAAAALDEKTAAHLTAVEQRVRAMIVGAEREAGRLAEGLLGQLTHQAGEIHREQRSALEAMGRAAAASTEAMRKEVGQLERAAGEVRACIEGELGRGVDALKGRAAAVAEPVLRDLEERQAAFEQRLAWLANNCEQTLARQKAAMAAEAARLGAEADARLGALRDEFGVRAGECLAGLRTKIEEQAKKAVAEATATMVERLGELRQCGEIAAQAFEQRLAQMLGDARPKLARALDEAEQAARERLGRAVETIQARVEILESQLTGRIDALGPAAAAAAKSAQAEIAGQLAQAEREAHALTAGLEKRLAGRMDELVDRLQRVMRNELESATPAPPETAAPSVAVEVYLDAQRKPSRASGSAG